MPSDNDLIKASKKGDLEECKRLIEEPDDPDNPDDALDVNAPGASGRRAIHQAAGAGFTAVVEYLLENKAQIEIADDSGRTALIYASIGGHVPVVQLLLSKGANILHETKTTKMNALHGAVEAGKVDVVTALLTHLAGADEEVVKKRDALCNAKNSDGKTPCNIAEGTKNKAMIDKMKALGDKNAASSSCTIS